MRELLKRLLKIITGYGMVQWAGPLLSFVFTPIITRILTPSDYGIADLVLTIGSAVSMLALFAQPQALSTHFNDRPSDIWRRHVVGSSLTLSLLIGIPISLLLITQASAISQATFHTSEQTVLFRIIGATIAFGLCGAILTAASQAALRVRWGIALGLGTIIGTVVGNCVFIIILRLGAAGLVLTQATTGILVCLLAIVVVRPLIGAPSPDMVKLMTRSGAILLPAMLSGWALTLADRLFLVQYVSTTDLGYYAIANKITGLLHIALTPIYAAWMALALSIQREPDARQRYAEVSRYIIGAALAGALMLGLFATEILIVMTRPAYLPAAQYIGFLAYAQVFTAFGAVLTTGALASKQLSAVSLTTAAGAIVNLILNALLIPRFGVWGATIATVIGYGVPQVLLYFIIQKRYPIPYPVGRLLAALLIQFVLLGLGTMLPQLRFPISIVIKLALFAMLPLAFVLLGIITRFELQQSVLFVRHQAQQNLDRLRR